ncbi:DUF47 domain-containing protein [Buchananella hordeovulneris]|uniref:Phosphate transport regulator n=1 Tax=Buchananella hordeovulneris TaxID=52770 RepID=A0A1Q5PYW8_9ACTO|nr:DUF47 family protein [Buchananella hordeovulneris]MDO5081558.1 DUF47 family protein [Buchananella hordeovulneris]OKL52652.1 phosphate transport regulator [Buchananella hordeovulneris]
MGFHKNDGPDFFELFSSQANLLVEGVNLVASIVGAPAATRVALRDQLHSYEHEADELNHSVVKLINLSFVTPFEREDLNKLASLLDDAMDYLDEAGDLFVLYDLVDLPQPLLDLLATQIDVLKHCAEQTAVAMPRLKKPLELRDYWVEVNRLENEGDRAFRKALTELFETQKDPRLIVKLKDVITVLERCTDKFESLANTIEAIAVKEA